MYSCPKCQLNLEEDASFCGNCGQAVAYIHSSLPNEEAAKMLLADSSSLIRPVYNNDNSSNGVPVVGLISDTLGAQAVPAYAKEINSSTANKGEIEATIGLLLGVIAIPSALFIPLVALALGVAGLVLSTIGRSKYKQVLSFVAVLFSILGLLSGLVVWGYAVSKHSSPNSAPTTIVPTSNLVAVATPCYSAMIDSGMQNYSSSNCSFDAASNSEEFSVNATNNANITTANLAQVGPEIFKQALGKTGGTYISGSTGIFANSPAYIIYADNNTDKTQGIYALVIHPSAKDNIYIVGHTTKNTYQPTFGPLETSWQWR